MDGFSFLRNLEMHMRAPGKLKGCSSMATSAYKFTASNKPPLLINRRKKFNVVEANATIGIPCNLFET